MKTIGNIIHNKTFPLFIRDNKGKVGYFEDYNGFWVKQMFNENGQEIYYENSEGNIQDSSLL